MNTWAGRQQDTDPLLDMHMEALRKQRDKQRQTVSFHEAGHAVLATYLGYKVRKVSIVPDSTALGYCHRETLNYQALDEMTARTSAINEILICYGGHAAESLVNHHRAPHTIDRIAREGGRTDHEKAWRLLPIILGGLDADATYKEREISLRLNRAYLNYQAARAYKFVRSEPLQAAIHALANELLGWDEMTGDEAREVMEKVLDSMGIDSQRGCFPVCPQNPAT